MKNQKKHKFSIRKIKWLLDKKAYKDHGLERKDYIKLCKEKWGEDSTEVKVIVDRLHPGDLRDIIKGAGYHIDYAIQAFWNKLPIEDFEENEIIKCLSFSVDLMDSNTGKRVDKIPIVKPEYWSDKKIEEGEYFLCFFDLLGFSNLVSSTSSMHAYNTIETILKKARINRPYTVMQTALDAKDGEYSLPTFFKVPFKYAYYSDSIIFWAPGFPGALPGFIAKCIDFFNHSLKEKILLRGSISHGKAILNKTKNIFIGKPLIEASDLEKNQKWVGVALAESLYSKKLLRDVSTDLVMGAFPQMFKEHKNDSILHMGINWIDRLTVKEHRLIITNLKAIRETVPQKAAEYISTTIRYSDYNLAARITSKKFKYNLLIKFDFPKRIEQSFDSVNLNSHLLMKIVFIRLKSGEAISGLILPIELDTNQVSSVNEDILFFAQINFMPECEKLINDMINQKEIDLFSLKWILGINKLDISDIYFFE